MNEVKTLICTGAGVIGGFIAAALGGWDLGLQTLLIFMAADYITGLIVAGVPERFVYNSSLVSVNGDTDKLPLIFAEKALILSSQLVGKIPVVKNL